MIRKICLKTFVILGCTIFLFSCYRELELQEPKLSEEVMVGVLADIHLAEGQITQYTALTPHARDSIASQHYITIFKLYNITAEDFEQSMNAFMGNPDALSKLYEKVLDKLKKDEAIYGKE